MTGYDSDNELLLTVKPQWTDTVTSRITGKARRLVMASWEWCYSCLLTIPSLLSCKFLNWNEWLIALYQPYCSLFSIFQPEFNCPIPYIVRPSSSKALNDLVLSQFLLQLSTYSMQYFPFPPKLSNHPILYTVVFITSKNPIT